jgi:hypothetical protein
MRKGQNCGQLKGFWKLLRVGFFGGGISEKGSTRKHTGIRVAR